MKRRPSSGWIVGLTIVAIVAGVVAFQRYQASNELARMQDSVAQSRQEARGIFEGIGLPLQSTPLSGLEISSRSRGQDSKWRETPTSFMLSQKWDTVGDFPSAAKWFKEKLGAQGWQEIVAEPPDPRTTKFFKGKWSVSIEQGNFFADGPNPHVEFLVSLEYDYFHDFAAPK